MSEFEIYKNNQLVGSWPSLEEGLAAMEKQENDRGEWGEPADISDNENGDTIFFALW